MLDDDIKEREELIKLTEDQLKNGVEEKKPIGI
jgi:hypothetical protein